MEIDTCDTRPVGRDGSSESLFPNWSKNGTSTSALPAQVPEEAWMDLAQVRPLEPPKSHDYPPGHYACTQFFQSLGEGSFEGFPSGIHWQYAMRREAQMILPFLYLGPTSAARDIEFLKRVGITLVLAVRSRHASHAFIVNADKAACAAGIDSDHIDVEDFYELITMLPQAIRRINDHVCRCPDHSKSKTTEKKVLVFCETGNERSASLLTAYLMVMYNFRMHTALSHVQGRRLCVNVDFPVRDVLMSFDAILIAQRDVSRASRLAPEGGIYGNNGVKRPHKLLGRKEGNAEVQDSGDASDEEMGENEHPTKRQNVEDLSSESNGLRN
ncbi:hypothetical protein PRK78_002107 [Emydomyces testavorans]|uniref:Tyrosine specific protein phosphatases domain-containing protein n=1 Tax=Emydomyces testavorans TaxID=2070801 RepID=A0AAF0DEF4_9EURO|nr:hypothetical protein PRK78_002107 [Emydomyces testavorans]